MAEAEGAPLIFFDVLDTLVHNPFFREIPAFFGMTLKELLAAKHPTSWVEFELGQISEAEYLRRMFRDERQYDTAAFRATVRGAYRWIDGMEALVADLRGAGRELHTLSNYPAWYRVIEEQVGLSRYVKWTSVSCLTGARKPAAEAFLAATRLAGRAPADCLLIDDSRENCAGAERVGMAAIHFENAAELRRELAARGLLPR